MGILLPKTLCVLCGKPIDFSLDLSADEHGKAVHTDCYTERIINRPNTGENALSLIGGVYFPELRLKA